MLTEICGEVRNYFIRDRQDIYSGTFTIENGTISLPFLKNGQYFRIVGSALNDGVWEYPAVGLKDETFDGSVWAMYVPVAFAALAVEIKDWVENNAEALNSPYQSESFGGYSYSKSTGANGSSGFGWRDQFSTRLNQWRRLSVL